MLAVEDYLEALQWAKSVGGLEGLIARSDANAAVIHDWVARTPWVANLARDPATASNTSVCLLVSDREVLARGPDTVAGVAKGIASALEAEGVALDIGAYRDAPPGLRIWCGATVETADLEALTPWLEWAFAREAGKLARAA
jgi:phosphoserine aminotransferase